MTPLIPVGTEFPAVCDYEGERVAFTYRTIAPTEMQRIQRETGGAAIAFALALAAATLVRWNLPEPPTAEVLAQEDAGFLLALLTAANADLQTRMGQAAQGGELQA